ncbi:glycosyltransferase family 4 protein [Polaribacter batillariae]|uniref:Glycosyltransferase family 4 protein n=1 Tax=Polaribacter batillariae TaxID=2808900 RepID=A0ABX7SX68_9FLAO|nr:glycosyltransferase family 4 protein [Polaribacter batillariae]QTD37576.1 glycosyltransferase family 4 protein [Polaribacter batillariae]
MKKKLKTILYIGNNLTAKTKYNSTLAVLVNLLKIEGYRVHISSSKLNKLSRLLDMCLSVIKYRNKVDYILIDTFSTKNFYYALITSQLAKIFSIKYIPILHGGNLPTRIKKNVFLSKLIFKNSYKNIAPSNYLKVAFENEGYRVDFIPNIIEIEQYEFKKREKLQPKLLWVRAFKEIYNPTLAIEVLYLLKNEYPNAKLCMVGPFVDNSYNNCLSLVEKYNLHNSVEFTNVLLKEEWHKVSVDYDIFINTTNFDNTPVSVMEAMALGLPVVTTNVGGIPYLLEDKVDAFLVGKNNPKLMVEAIIKLLKNDNLIICRNARKKVETFSWNHNKTKWLQILK